MKKNREKMAVILIYFEVYCIISSLRKLEGKYMCKKLFFLISIVILLITFSLSFAKTEKVALNFDDVDISVFLKTMSDTPYSMAVRNAW